MTGLLFDILEMKLSYGIPGDVKTAKFIDLDGHIGVNFASGGLMTYWQTQDLLQICNLVLDELGPTLRFRPEDFD